MNGKLSLIVQECDAALDLAGKLRSDDRFAWGDVILRIKELAEAGCDSAKEDDSTFRCDECGGSLQDGYVTFCRKCGGRDSAKESAEPEEWISVDERLPEITEEWKDGPNHYGESDRVLFIAQGIIMVGVLDKSGTWATFDGEAFKQVTHWMPLPKPPEHAQKGK